MLGLVDVEIGTPVRYDRSYLVLDDDITFTSFCRSSWLSRRTTLRTSGYS